MAALATKTFVTLSRQHAAPAVGVVHVSQRHQSNLATFKRGTGGRSSFSGMVCTVFGASGNLGRCVVNRLGKIGSQIIIPYRSDPYFQRDLKLAGDLGQVLFVPYFLKDEESIYKAMKYSNVVVNLVERDYDTKTFSMEQINDEGATRIARIAKELGVQKYVHLSHFLANPNPPSIFMKGGSRFLKAKFNGEQGTREAFPEAIVMRATDIAERYVEFFASKHRRNFAKIRLYKRGEETIKSPVFLSDLAEGIISAIRDPDTDGKLYDCAGGESYYMSDLVDYMIGLMRREEYLARGFTNPIYQMKIAFWQRLYVRMKHPYSPLTFEKQERESISEIVSGRNPTLEDLGVKLMHIPDRFPYEFIPYHYHGYYEEQPGEIPDPPPPPTVQERESRTSSQSRSMFA